MSLAYALYQAAGWAGLGLGWPVVAVRAARDPRYRVGWAERLGRWAAVAGRPVWLHGASVGELRAAAPVAARLRDRGVPLVVSATSPAGRDQARALAGDDRLGRLLPLDLGPLVRRAVRAASARALVLVETELWPALLREAGRSGTPALLVNARLSDRAFPRYLRARRWIGPVLHGFDRIQAQSQRDAERFERLGAPAGRLEVGGNLKFDLPEPDPADPVAGALRRCRAGGWRVVVAGSTHPGEEDAVLRAAARLEGRGHRVGVVIAPRHLERLAEVEAAAAAAGRGSQRWTGLGDPAEAGLLAAFGRGDVVVVDGYGLLSRLYGGAEAAFVGGTLVPVGGHNLLEPLNWGVPVAFGPHTHNAPEVADAVLGRDLGRAVDGPDGLAEAWAEALASPDRADRVARASRELFDANRGAADRAVAALARVGVLDEAWDSTSG